MKITVEIEINAPKENVWAIITDIENSVETISGIDKIEIIHQPDNTVIGLKWKETRTIFGKPATETMWITEANENDYYKTRAESNGAIYQTILKLTAIENVTTLTMEFSSKAVSTKGKIMAFIFSALLKRSMKKLIYQDLVDIKNVTLNQ